MTYILHSCPECGCRLEMDDDLLPGKYACPTGCGHIEEGTFIPISMEMSMEWVGEPNQRHFTKEVNYV